MFSTCISLTTVYDVFAVHLVLTKFYLYLLLFSCQLKVLTKAKQGNPKGRWWIKADACHVCMGLRESVCGEWSGDEDLGSGELKVLYEECKSRCAFVQALGVQKSNFARLNSALEADLTFLVKGDESSKKQYEQALQVSGKSKAKLMELAWNSTGFTELVKQANEFKLCGIFTQYPVWNIYKKQRIQKSSSFYPT